VFVVHFRSSGTLYLRLCCHNHSGTVIMAK